jgi:arabinogalactan oligomer/maltooligosaccharide transport system substrate-binding protein
MKKTLLFLMLALMLLSLAACGGGGGEAAPTEAPAVEQPAAEQPAAEEPTAAPAAEEPMAGEIALTMWTQEGQSEGVFQYVEELAQRYKDDHPNVSIEVVNYETEDLREQFQTASLAGAAPDFVWTVNDHAGPFTTAGLIQPVDDLVDLSQFVDNALAAVELNGQHWGIPITNGNHLMLLYNQGLVDMPPQDTDELIAMGQNLTQGDQVGLAYNLTEPFWLAPWWGGFGLESVFDADLNPQLNNESMINALQFVHDLKFDSGIVPQECDYDCMDTLFKEGKAAMIINGDWSLGAYEETEGLDFSVSRIPLVVATDEWPHPYTSGKYFMFSKDLSSDRLDAALGFANFVSANRDIQLELVEKFSRLPALKAALDAPIIGEDPILAGSADQMVVGTPMPTVPQMRCIWDAIRPQLEGVMADSVTPEDAAAEMQTSAEICIEDLG